MNLGSAIPSIGYHFIEMLLAPVDEVSEDWHQGAACLSQRILHPWGNLWINLAMHQMTLLQILQCLREHLLGTVRHQATDLIEAQYAGLVGVEHIEYQH